jgi:hypothetical protein
MIWWLKVRAAPTLAIGTAATWLLGLLLGTARLPVPALTGQAGDFLVGHLITLAPAVLLMHGAARADHTAENVAVRTPRHLDVALALTLATTVLTAALLLHLLHPTDLAVVLSRNIAGYTGLALLLHPWIGHRAAGALIAVVPLGCAAAGWGPGGRPERWAWVLHPADSRTALALALATLLLGTTTALTRRPRTSP